MQQANMSPMGHLATVVALVAVATAVPAAPQDEPSPAARRRQALLRTRGDGAKAIAALSRALDDRDPLVARTAARLLARRGAPALRELRRALRSDDVLVRRAAAMGLGAIGPEALDALEQALHDPHALVRQAAVTSLALVRPRSERTLALLAEASRDEAGTVREAATQAIRSSYRTVQEVRLPKEGWKFRRDPGDVGREEGWFAPGLDDSDWDDIEIEQAWQHFGHDYIGVAWYRRTISLPALEAPQRAQLAFQGVDENAWVWVNGEYAGDHAIGPEGWDDPFWLGVTELLRWGEDNQITVRAMNTAFAGGIWRPVSIAVLELAE
jgi:hypothetical protein